MTKVFLGLLGVAISSSSVSAQQAPADYIAFGEYAEEAAQIVTSVRSCARMGFSVNDDPGVPLELSDRALRTAVRMGVDRSTAESMVVAAIEDETADMELMSSVPDYIDTAEELVAHFRETIGFWDSRCRSLASSSLGSEYIQVSGNEEATQQALIDRVVAAANGES